MLVFAKTGSKKLKMWKLRWSNSVTFLCGFFIVVAIHSTFLKKENWRGVNIFLKNANVGFWSSKKPNRFVCSVPKLDPFDLSIKHLVKEPDFEDCSEEYPLFFNSSAGFELIPTGIFVKNKSLEIHSCCFKEIQRGDDDNSYKFSEKCTNFSLAKRFKLSEVEFIAIFCNKIGSNKTIVDMHAFVPLKPRVEYRINENNSRIPTDSVVKDVHLKTEDRVNVVIFGIDSTSRMNFLRTMPLSYTFLMKELAAVEFRGVNKVGSNTFPNVAAALTYKNVSELNATCSMNDTFDECPFIWKEYSTHGYRTSYAEDTPWLNAFNYLAKGFVNPPTDYYLRPFSLAAEVEIATHKRMNTRLCYGPKLAFQVLLDYMKKFAHTMGHSRRYFQFIWSSSLTHDYSNLGSLGDKHLLTTLKWFKNSGYLNKTVLILLSDHGARYGEIRETSQGRLEENLPYLFQIYPAWFKKKYQKAYKNLYDNRDVLTTPFDFYKTLQDLLHLVQIEEKRIIKRESVLKLQERKKQFPRGISQFLPLPESRTCEMAGIRTQYCGCTNTTPISTNSSVAKQAAPFLVFYINSMISKHSQCAYLNLETIVKVTHVTFSANYRYNVGFYQLTIRTKPGNAMFEAWLGKKISGEWKIDGTVSRINSMKNESGCVEDRNVKLYCYCTRLMD